MIMTEYEIILILGEFMTFYNKTSLFRREQFKYMSKQAKSKFHEYNFKCSEKKIPEMFLTPYSETLLELHYSYLFIIFDTEQL